MRLALLIPDGPGVRNFVSSRFLSLAQEHGTAYIFHNVPARLITNGLNGRNGAQWLPLLPQRDDSLTFGLRAALTSGHMYRARTNAMRFNLQLPIRGSLKVKTAVRAARVLGRIAATSAVGLHLLDRWYAAEVARFPEVARYRELFGLIKPSLLFSSNQRSVNVLPPVLAAKSMGIPTATFIFSWDNLTSKGRIAAPFDHYLVWSEQMGRELLTYYPEISAETVHVVGTPQFDPYADEELLFSRSIFCAAIGADPNRPLICYSGGDETICPEDPKHVAVLMDLVRAGAIQRKPQVVLRPSPADPPGRYDEVRKAYPELIYAPPRWAHPEKGDWTEIVPLPEDTRLLANLTHHANVNVNVASTMTLDFAIHDKPVVNIAWDIADPPPFATSLWDHHYQFEHYRPVIEFGAARFARSPEELKDHVNAYLNNPRLDREGRRRLVEFEVALPLGHASERVLECLKEISG